MAKFPKDLSAGNLHPRESLFITGNLSALASEIILPADGSASLSVDLRGTFVATFEVQGTVNGTDWLTIPIRPINQAAIKYTNGISAPGVWVGKCAPFRFIRLRNTAFTSGLAVAVLLTDNASLDDSLVGMVTTDIVTNVAAAGSAVTLTIPSPGAGLRNYLTYLAIIRFASATLTAAATPVTVTTTNLPGAVAFTLPADALTIGSTNLWREDFAFPLASSAQATATTIICPATPNVIYRLTAGYYVGP